MAAGRLIVPGWSPAVDADGVPIPNARVFFYLNKTTTLATVFSDEAMTVPLVNPVPSNASGRFPAVWADDSVLYSASVDAPYGPAGIPFTYDNLSASMAADILVVEVAEAAAAAAQEALDEVNDAIDAATQAGGGDAALAGALAAQAIVAGKADTNGGNITDKAAFRESIETVSRSGSNVEADAFRGAIGTFATRAAAMAHNFGGGNKPSAIRLDGYASAGDGGGALYKPVGAEPSHEAKFQTADGAWWEMANKHVHPEMFGAKGDGVTDDSWPIAQAVGFATSIEFLAKTYVGTINAWRSVRIFGQGRNFTTLVCPAATGSAVNLAASPYYLKGMTVTRSAIATAGLGVATQVDGYGTLEDLIVSQHWDGIQFNSTANSTATSVYARMNYNDGFVFLTSGTSEACQWKVTNAVSEMNNGWGVSAYAVAITNPDQTGPVLVNVGTYKNGMGGWIWSGAANTAWNDVNGVHCYSSFDNGPGMYFVNPGANNQFLDSFVEFASMVAGGRSDGVPARLNASGIQIEGGARNDSSLLFVGLVTMQNALSGIVNTGGSSLKTLQLQGVRAVDNGRASGADRYGIYLGSASTRAVITNATAQGLLFTSQQYGVAVGSAGIAGKTSVIGGAMNGNSAGATNTDTADYAAWLGVLA